MQANFSKGWEGPLPTDPQPRWENFDISSEPFEAVYKDCVVSIVH